MPDLLYFKDEWFTVVVCDNCGLGFVNPRPTFSEMSRYYPSSYFKYFDEERDSKLRRYEAEARFLQDFTMKKREKLLLDIGCANGDFPRFMKNLGWQVEGVEVSSVSKPISDFKVYRQEFTEIPVSEVRYDAITAWAVLEHVHDPMAYFMKAADVVKPKGTFIFLVTNFKSISSRYLFREDLPRHLYYFTEETIRTYLGHSGFDLIQADYSNTMYSMRPLNWLRYYVYRYFLGRGLELKDIPDTRIQYFDKRGLRKNMFSSLKYITVHPFTVIDRILMPLYEKYQMLSNKYGIVTYVAIKC